MPAKPGSSKIQSNSSGCSAREGGGRGVGEGSRGAVAGTAAGSSTVTPARPVAPAPIPKNLSFLFRVDSLLPNFDAEPYRATQQGTWDPPNKSHLYTRKNGDLYRWLGGRVQLVPPDDRVKGIKALTKFGAATVFTTNPNLLAVNFDAGEAHVCSNGGWRPLSFKHYGSSAESPKRYLSFVDPEALHPRMPAPGAAHWTPQLIPHVYNWQEQSNSQGLPSAPPRINDGLVGKLPVLIAIAVFSAPSRKMNDVLTNHIWPNQWRLHNYASGRGCAHRGMVVTVYLDPISHHESTAEKLKKLEDGGFGPFYRS